MDVAIIGGGVAGLYSAYCCHTVGLSCMLFEALPYLGGQCMAFYPDKPLYGVPGQHKVLAKCFINELVSQCLNDQVKLYLNTPVSVTKNGNLFILETKDNQKFEAKFLVIASGIGVMESSIPATVKGAIELANTSDFVQCYCLNPELYRGKDVVVAGGGNSAIDHVLCISKVAKSVTLLHRRDTFSCDQNKLKEFKSIENKNIHYKMNQQIVELQPGTVITDKEIIYTDRIVFCYGLHVNQNSMYNFSPLELEIHKNLIKVELSSMKTSENHCYAVGDVVSYPGKTKGILSCCYESQLAVHSIATELRMES